MRSQRSTPAVAQDMLLFLSSFNKPFPVTVDLLAFLSGLRAPLAFGGHFCISLFHGTTIPSGWLQRLPTGSPCFPKCPAPPSLFSTEQPHSFHTITCSNQSQTLPCLCSKPSDGFPPSRVRAKVLPVPSKHLHGSSLHDLRPHPLSFSPCHSTPVRYHQHRHGSPSEACHLQFLSSGQLLPQFLQGALLTSLMFSLKS